MTDFLPHNNQSITCNSTTVSAMAECCSFSASVLSLKSCPSGPCVFPPWSLSRRLLAADPDPVKSQRHILPIKWWSPWQRGCFVGPQTHGRWWVLLLCSSHGPCSRVSNSWCIVGKWWLTYKIIMSSYLWCKVICRSVSRQSPALSATMLNKPVVNCIRGICLKVGIVKQVRGSRPVNILKPNS